MGREVPRIESSARQLLENYDWPGNVRELQNVVQRLLLRNETEIGEPEVTDALGYHGDPGQADGVRQNSGNHIKYFH